MKVSIIVPVYNAENVLHYCIDSILNQTYKDFELILVDDGSTDRSGDICDEYALDNDNISVLHIQNGGVSRARNTGIERAKGDYICFVDSDDYIDQLFLEELVNKAEEGYNFVLTAYQWVENYNYNATRTIFYKDDESYSVLDRNSLMSLSNLVLLPQPWNKLFKRDIVINEDIRMPEDISLGEDTTFVYRYLSVVIDQSFVVINKPLYYYFNSVDSGSLLNKYRDDLFEINVSLNNYLYQEIVKWNLSEEHLQMFFNSCYYRMENVLFNTFRKENKVSVKKKIEYNSSVLKTSEFQNWYKRFRGHINPVFRFAFFINNFLPIFVVYKLKGQ